jgi:hypothetical protein
MHKSLNSKLWPNNIPYYYIKTFQYCHNATAQTKLLAQPRTTINVRSDSGAVGWHSSWHMAGQNSNCVRISRTPLHFRRSSGEGKEEYTHSMLLVFVEKFLAQRFSMGSQCSQLWGAVGPMGGASCLCDGHLFWTKYGRKIKYIYC